MTISLCLMYLTVRMLGAHVFIIAISSSWIDPLVIM